MGMSPYDIITSPATRRGASRVPTATLNMNVDNPTSAGADTTPLSTKLDMLMKSACIDMGGACYKGTGATSHYRQAAKSASNMRQKSRRNSVKRCRRVCSFSSQIDSSLLDDFYNSQTKCILSKITDWSFDVFALEKASNGRALFHVILRLFQHHNLIEHFNLDVVKLMTFATLVEEGYQNNPYHNATHAADVTQAMHCYISQGKIAKHMTPIEILISLVSAITHDLDHPGVNQGFLIATNNHLANLYENKAVLEKHHWRAALAVLHQTGLFDHLSQSVRSKIEMEMKSLILATDMTRQHDFLTTLKTRVLENSLDMSVYSDRHFILQISLKCADISNPCRHWSACNSWSDKVCKEFFRQGDFERELNLPISNLCDRYNNTIPKIQTGFIAFCVEPLFTEFERYLFPSSMLSEQLTNLQLNKQKWQQMSTPRPTTLTFELNVDTSASDIPSPTVSEAGDLPSPTESKQCANDNDFLDEPHNIIVNTLDRRHSVPVLNLLETKHLLTRRQSFPDRSGSKFVSKKSDIHTVNVALLDKLAGHLVCVKNDKPLSKFIEKLIDNL